MNTMNNSPRLCTSCSDNYVLIDGLNELVKDLTEENDELIKENKRLKAKNIGPCEIARAIVILFREKLCVKKTI